MGDDEKNQSTNYYDTQHIYTLPVTTTGVKQKEEKTTSAINVVSLFKGDEDKEYDTRFAFHKNYISRLYDS